uniref:NADH dehydrogenase subunit 6 n=1 Tax=Neoperla bimaculata TaxID=2908267 RepID=UPI001EDD22FC|nr:NADH dehydrogenase subunit 6 [Neoperla bimaculata]UIF93994.1 NADH dehydrogenase subunit 6 [Neoperla bimaculata]
MTNSLFLMLSSLISLTFTQINHPLAMGLILLTQTLVVCFITGLLSQSFWFSYILFLVFLGGLLVLFIYVTSLASNEMFSLDPSTFMPWVLFFLISTLGIFFFDPILTLTNTKNTDLISSILMSCQQEASPSLMKLYNSPTYLITLMLALYLFLTLIAVVQITDIFMGPLRSTN